MKTKLQGLLKNSLYKIIPCLFWCFNLNLENYVPLINNLGDVSAHYASFCKIDNVWEDIMQNVDGIDFNEINVFLQERGRITEIQGENYYVISREYVQNYIDDIENNHDEDEDIDMEELRRIYLLILMWGYPNGNRGNAELILNNPDGISDFHQQYIINPEHEDLRQRFIDASNFHFNGMGSSTITKIFYFFREQHVDHALILDSMMKNIINYYDIDQFNDIGPNTDNGKVTFSGTGYQLYCETLYEVSEELHVDVDLLEYFLFAIVRNLDCANLE